ncbi:MAG: ABC transporter ATP-binding protein [Candidatus Aenigmarchaeota archaeon]|nr:ABC transporter ATP-binding protein [Candidatus Aenigmarchaeota archaeon]
MKTQKRKLPHPVINALKTEWKFLGKKKKIFFLYMLFFVIAGIISLATPYVIGIIFNDIQNSITTDAELFRIQLNILLLLLLTLSFWVFHGIARVLERRTGFLVKTNFINDKIFKVLDLSTKWHKDHHSGNTIDKINRASNSLGEFSSHITFQITYALVSLFGSLIILFLLDWKIGVFATVFSSIVIFVITRFDKVLHKMYRELNVFNNKYSSAVFDFISNVTTIISLRLKNVVARDINKKRMASFETYKRTVILDELKWAVAGIAIQVMVVVSLIYRSSVEFAMTGTILIGSLYMLYGYLKQVGDTFYRFAEIYGNIIRYNARIVGSYSLDDAYSKVKKKEAINLPKKWQNISLKNISFKYNQRGKTKHIDDINFQFSRGQKIALVGESGSGKSTILLLIRGLYKVESGDVYCDGKKIESGLESIRKHVTLIPQEPEIFNQSFKYNITMNLPTKRDDMQKAIDMSQLRPVLAKLPKGLNTSVMEKGVSLSGGEKQRLALARGLLAAKNSDIILLDEPTSSVDNMNEVRIHEQIFSEFKDKTIISSIHRLHLLNRFDYIYLFSRGKIIGEGTYKQIRKNTIFRKMLLKYGKNKPIDEAPKKKSGPAGN